MTSRKESPSPPALPSPNVRAKQCGQYEPAPDFRQQHDNLFIIRSDNHRPRVGGSLLGSVQQYGSQQFSSFQVDNGQRVRSHPSAVQLIGRQLITGNQVSDIRIRLILSTATDFASVAPFGNMMRPVTFFEGTSTISSCTAIG